MQTNERLSVNYKGIQILKRVTNYTRGIGLVFKRHRRKNIFEEYYSVWKALLNHIKVSKIEVEKGGF